MPPFYFDNDNSINRSFPTALVVRIAMVSALVASFLQTNSASVSAIVGLVLVAALFEVGGRVADFAGNVVKDRFMTTKSFQEETMEYQWLMAYMVQQRVFADPELQTSRTSAVTQKPLSKSFLWRGSWVKVTQIGSESGFVPYGERALPHKYNIELIIYSLKASPISKFLDESKKTFSGCTRRQELVTIYILSQDSSQVTPYPPPVSNAEWTDRVHKPAPVMDATALTVGSLTALVDEAANFWESESWYNEVGMPFRKGYLLHGPSGSGQRDAVLAIAGKLGRVVYTLSLKGAMPMLNNPYATANNTFLVKAISAIPKGSIFLLEHLDECFARPDAMPGNQQVGPCFGPCCSSQQTSTYGPTMSGIIEMLDAITREQGILFFATADKLDGMDNALLQPGRIDKKVEFGYVNEDRARILFNQFFPDSTPDIAPPRYDAYSGDVKYAPQTDLAAQFASQIPAAEFALADVRNYLVAQRAAATEPMAVVAGVSKWVETQRAERVSAKEKEARMLEELERKKEKHRQPSPMPRGRMRSRWSSSSPLPSMIPSEVVPTLAPEAVEAGNLGEVAEAEED